MTVVSQTDYIHARAVTRLTIIFIQSVTVSGILFSPLSRRCSSVRSTWRSLISQCSGCWLIEYVPLSDEINSKNYSRVVCEPHTRDGIGKLRSLVLSKWRNGNASVLYARVQWSESWHSRSHLYMSTYDFVPAASMLIYGMGQAKSKFGDIFISYFDYFLIYPPRTPGSQICSLAKKHSYILERACTWNSVSTGWNAVWKLGVLITIVLYSYLQQILYANQFPIQIWKYRAISTNIYKNGACIIITEQYL